MKCKHRKTWLLMDGRLEWCYQCGAHRPMGKILGNIVTPCGAWRVPTGPGGKNPFDASVKGDKTWEKIRETKMRKAGV